MVEVLYYSMCAKRKMWRGESTKGVLTLKLSVSLARCKPCIIARADMGVVVEGVEGRSSVKVGR